MGGYVVIAAWRGVVWSWLVAALVAWVVGGGSSGGGAGRGGGGGEGGGGDGGDGPNPTQPNPTNLLLRGQVHTGHAG